MELPAVSRFLHRKRRFLYYTSLCAFTYACNCIHIDVHMWYEHMCLIFTELMQVNGFVSYNGTLQHPSANANRCQFLPLLLQKLFSYVVSSNGF